MRPRVLADRSSRWMPRPANCCGSTANMKAPVPPLPPVNFRAADCRIGPTAKATTGSCTSRRDIGWCAWMPRPACPIKSFGIGGLVDMKTFAVYGTGQPIDLVQGEIGLHSTPAVTRSGVVIVGSSFREGNAPKTHNNTKGLVLAFDVRTGKKLWQFNTIPRPGEIGNDTWQQESWAINGNTGVWTQIAVDEQLGLVYLPVETPTSDYYGGQRPGNNLFAETLVCVDLKTGKRKWHFQLVHHPIWDYDISSAPILADINVNGRAIKAVIQPTKQCWLFVFDRVTGQPVWPIEERAVPQSEVPGEKTSPTQPFPTKPPAYSRQGVSLEDLIDFTPELHAEAAKLAVAISVGSDVYACGREQSRRSHGYLSVAVTGRRNQLARRGVRS